MAYSNTNAHLKNMKLDSLGDFIDGCVGLFDEKFPKYDVQNITNGEKPVFLTYKGDLDLLDKRHLKVTVIGLLNPTSDIENLESKIVSKMVDNSAIILSGLANGCDSVAHKTTLNRGGATVAFLPSTLKNILPKENLELAKEIVISGGLLVSEYYEDVEVTNRFSLNALSDRYIKRDRLQALFSNMVCLAASYSKDDSFENGKKTNKDSGARHALEKALKWGIARAAMYGDDEIFKDGMFNLNREIIKDGARIIDLDNVAEILEEIKNKKVKKRSDFLLVNDKRAFYMFDALSKKLQKAQNRSLNNFYILMADEFLSLLKGENIEFKNHKLEVKNYEIKR